MAASAIARGLRLHESVYTERNPPKGNACRPFRDASRSDAVVDTITSGRTRREGKTARTFRLKRRKRLVATGSRRRTLNSPELEERKSDLESLL